MTIKVKVISRSRSIQNQIVNVWISIQKRAVGLQENAFLFVSKLTDSLGINPFSAIFKKKNLTLTLLVQFPKKKIHSLSLQCNLTNCAEFQFLRHQCHIIPHFTTHMIAPKIIRYRSNRCDKVIKHIKRGMAFDLLIVPKI